MSSFHTLTDLALHADELLFGRPENLIAVRQLIETCLADPVQGNVDSLRLPKYPDNPSDWSAVRSEEDIVLTPAQRAVAMAAFHDVHCSEVEKVVVIPADLQWDGAVTCDWQRAVRWLSVLDRVRELGDYALPWFKLQLRRLERELVGVEPEKASEPAKRDNPPANQEAGQRDKLIQQLEPAVRLAYLTSCYAESKESRRLTDAEAYQLLKEYGISEGAGDRGELADYKLPVFDTWARYIRKARGILGENKYNRRSGRPRGKSIATPSEIEQRVDDE